MTETYPLLQDILTEGATAASLLPGLKQRVLQTNGQISALERGRCILTWLWTRCAWPMKLWLAGWYFPAQAQRSTSSAIRRNGQKIP